MNFSLLLLARIQLACSLNETKISFFQSKSDPYLYKSINKEVAIVFVNKVFIDYPPEYK